MSDPSYSISPRAMFQVTATAHVQGYDLHETMRQLDPLARRAAEGAGAAGRVAAEVERLLQAHGAAAREVKDRVESAVYHGDLAVTTYVRGDQEMAGEYGRASAVFGGPRVPPPPRSPGPAGPAPETVTGG